MDDLDDFDPKEAVRSLQKRIAEEDRLANNPKYVDEQQRKLVIPEEKMRPPPPKQDDSDLDDFDPAAAIKDVKRRMVSENIKNKNTSKWWGGNSNPVKIKIPERKRSNDGSVGETALRVGEYIDKEIGELGGDTWESVKAIPGAFADVATSTLGTGLEMLTQGPGQTIKALGAGAGRAVGANKLSAFVDGAEEKNAAMLNGRDPEKAYNDGYAKSLAENEAQDAEYSAKNPYATNLGAVLPGTAATIGRKTVPGMFIGAGFDVASQLAEKGSVDPSKIVGNVIGGQVFSQGARGVGASVKAIKNKGTDGLQKGLEMSRPEALAFVDKFDAEGNLDTTGSSRVKAAEGSSSANLRTQGDIERAIREQPSLYNKTARSIGEQQEAMSAHVRSKYDAMHESNKQTTGTYDPIENTPGQMIKNIDNVDVKYARFPIIKEIMDSIKVGLSDDLRTNGKIGEIVDADGVVTTGLVPLTPAESFLRAVELRKLVHNTIDTAIATSDLPGNKKIPVPERAALKDIMHGITNAFEENHLKDMDANTIELYKEANGVYAKNRRTTDVQDPINVVEPQADKWGMSNRPNADKVRAHYQQIDDLSRENFRKSIANQQETLGRPQNNLYQGLDDNKANIEKYHDTIYDRNLNASEWNSVKDPSGIAVGAARNVYGLKNFSNPQTQVKLINALRARRPKLAYWVEMLVVKPGQTIGMATLRSVAAQSRVTTEEAAKAFEDMGAKIEMD